MILAKLKKDFGIAAARRGPDPGVPDEQNRCPCCGGTAKSAAEAIELYRQERTVEASSELAGGEPRSR